MFSLWARPIESPLEKKQKGEIIFFLKFSKTILRKEKIDFRWVINWILLKNCSIQVWLERGGVYDFPILQT